MQIFVYMLKCRDGSYYVGTARGDLERRVQEHNSSRFGGYTSTRLPVELVWAQEFEDPIEAVAQERRLKGWRRAKKEALIAGDFEALKRLSSRRK